MTTALAEKNPVGSHTYKESVGPYNQKQATHTVYYYDPDDAVDAALKAEMHVLDSLGIEYEISDGHARHIVEVAFPGTQRVSEHPITADANPTRIVDAATAAPPGHVSPPESVGPNPPHAVLAKPRRDMTELEKAMDKENVAWAKARLMSAPDEFYDNTQSKTNPNAPDFRHKTHKIGVWVD